MDFADEEEHLRKRVAYQEHRELGKQTEISEEDILTTYKLSKRKENAFIKVTEHGNIRIFCGEVDPEQMDRQQASNVLQGGQDAARRKGGNQEGGMARRKSTRR